MKKILELNYFFKTAQTPAAIRESDISGHSSEFRKYSPFNNSNPYFVTIEMVNRLIAGYLRSNNFDHTFYLFCKEAKINENEVFDEKLVECLKNSLLYMKEEKKIQERHFSEEDILSNFGKHIDLLSRVDILILKMSIEEGRITIRDIASHFSCSHSKIKDIFHKYNIEYPKLKRGRPLKYAKQNLIDQILQYTKKFRVGYQRMTDVLHNMGFNISQNEVRHVYEQKGLFLYEKEYKPENEHILRFVAPFVNQIWHTDLHYLEKREGEEQKYLISFIDDRSRKIIYHEVLDDKTARSTATALQRAIDLVLIEANHVPHTIVTDNGKEFVANEFVDILNHYQIHHHKIHPYTPEENAKIERFWRTYDQAKTDESSIDEVIDQYNNFWPHKGLTLINKKKMTPQEAWDNMPKYDGSQSEDQLKVIYQ